MLREPKLSIKPVYLSYSTRFQYLLAHATFYMVSKHEGLRTSAENTDEDEQENDG